jgi:pimeloyl-ACP methyl ester carboxylesterase
VTELRRIALSTGVALNVALAGPEDAPAVILLHGFPESHRTWRGVAPLLGDRFRLVMPDQRGFGASDQPQEVEAYRAQTLVDDVFALAEAMGIERFALVGHDWGGAIAWPCALRGDPRLERLAIINAPHPVIFQKSVLEDEAQRAASQYINAFRTPGFERAIEAMGYETFFEKSFAKHADLSLIPAEERAHYIADWSRPGAMTAMLNWYRASQLVIPSPGETAPLPDWVTSSFPMVEVPTLVIWGMRDKALLPIQLEGLDALVPDLQVHRIEDAGHFVPWERSEAVAAALGPFLVEER